MKSIGWSVGLALVAGAVGTSSVAHAGGGPVKEPIRAAHKADVPRLTATAGPPHQEGEREELRGAVEARLKAELAARDAAPEGLRGPGPVNDLCSGAINLATLGFAAGASITVNSDNTGATADGGLPTCGVSPGAAQAQSGSLGVWYTLVGTGNRVSVSSCQQSMDLVCRVYCGDCATSTWSCVAGDDDGCVGTNNFAPSVSFCTTAGQTYHILLSRYGTATAGAPFAFTVADNGAACPATQQASCAGAPPANDNCSSAATVAIGASYRGTFANATTDGTLPACGPVADAGVWHRVVGDGSILRASTCNANTGGNSKIAVFAGACGVLNCVASNATSTCGASTRDDTAIVDWVSTSGTEYFLYLSGESTIIASAGAADYELSVASIGQPAVNDTCATAIPVTIGSPVQGNNIGASNDPGLPTCSALSTFNNGVWYRFTGNGNRMSVSTCDPATQLNTRVYVYTSPDCFNFTCVAANATAAPACSAPSNAATVTFCSTAAQEYYVLVTNDTSGTGTFVLHVDDLGPAGCVPTGACCAGGQCTITTQAACTGTYLGDNTACSPTASPNVAIPDDDLSGVASTIVIPASVTGTVTDLDIALIITHTWQGDVRVTLQHDNGPEISLIDQPGVPPMIYGLSAENYGDPAAGIPFILDDQAVPAQTYDLPQVADPGIDNVTGRWLPDAGPLSFFNGQPLAGTWTLRVYDVASGLTGTLNSWSLMSTPAAASPCGTSGPDCFSRGTPSGIGPCGFQTHIRPVAPQGHYVRGGADGAVDTGQCLGDWDGNGCIEPADVAAFVASWFFSAQNPGNTDGDIDCNNAAEPADVAAFVGRWFGAVTNPAGEGC